MTVRSAVPARLTEATALRDTSARFTGWRLPLWLAARLAAPQRTRS